MACEVETGPSLLARRAGPTSRLFVQAYDGRIACVEVARALDDGECGLAGLRRAAQGRLAGAELEVVDWKSGAVVSDRCGVGNGPLLVRPSSLKRTLSSPLLSPPRPGHASLYAFPEDAEAPAVQLVSTRRSGLKRLVEGVGAGLQAGLRPKLETEGLGGTYLFRSASGERLAMFKPLDEEPFAPNNPKGYVGRQLGEAGMVRAIRVGEAGLREVAAYLLDHKRFARVPRTALATISHPHCAFHVAPPSAADKKKRASRGNEPEAPPENPRFCAVAKLGSLQEYVRHDYDASEHGTSRFPASEVHRLGILDLRLYNTDRHTGNILVRKAARARQSGADLGGLHEARSSGGLAANLRGLSAASFDGDAVELIPIDHGYSLPETLEPVYFEWLHWPQASMPFSQDTLDYIASLNAEEDVAMLRRELPLLREGCLRVLQLTTVLLQRAAAAGLTLAEIGTLMSRPLVGIGEEPSELERVAAAAAEDLAALACAVADEDEDGSEGDGSLVGGALLQLSPVVAPKDAASADDCGADCCDVGDGLQFDMEEPNGASSNAAGNLSSPGTPSAPQSIPRSARPNRLAPSSLSGSLDSNEDSMSPDSFVGTPFAAPFMSPARPPPRSQVVASSASPMRPTRALATAALLRGQGGVLSMAPPPQLARSMVARQGAGMLQRQRSRGGLTDSVMTIRSAEPGSPTERASDANAFAAVSPEGWHVYIETFSARVDAAVTAQRAQRAERRPTTQLVTDAGTRLQPFGTSCPTAWMAEQPGKWGGRK